MINPDIDLIEVGKRVFLCAKNFLISEHNDIMTIDLRSSNNHFLKIIYSFHLPFRLILTMQGELKYIYITGQNHDAVTN